MNKLATSFIICLAFLFNQACAGDPEKVKGHGNFSYLILNGLNFKLLIHD